MDGTEVVCQSNKGGKATSGGGFSTQYPRPDWQAKASNNYFAQMNGTTEMPYPGYGSGRGYPDISAAGAHFASFAGGDMISVSSTAASTSVVAGMLSLINSLRLKNGRRSVGWINPIIYGFSGSFMNDITVGKNNCNKWEECCEEGFSAAPGWDPVSGLGSIDFKRFKKFMMNLDPYSEPLYPEPTSQPTRLQSLYTIPITVPDKIDTEFPSAQPSSAPSSESKEIQSPPNSLPPPIATASAAPFAVPVLLPVHTTPTDNSVSTSVPSAHPTAARTLHAPLLIAYSESLSASPTPALISPQSAYPTSREPNIGHLWRPTRGPYTPFPTLLLVPTNMPKEVPISSPTSALTQVPTATPSCAPSAVPSLAPSLKLDQMKPTGGPISTSTPPALPPATRPSYAPFDEYHYSRPTRGPDTAYPTRTSSVPSCVPTGAPTSSPTSTPTKAPTTAPTSAPSCVPKGPTASPTSASCPPRRNPVSRPTRKPTSIPVSRPTRKPTSIPTPKSSKNRKSVRPSSSFPTPSCSKTK